MDLASLSAEIQKIAPVTRFLCGSTLAATLPVMLHVLDYRLLLFWKPWVLGPKYQLWRIPTSFFYGSTGLNFIFDFVMLYRTSSSLEETHFPRQSQNYAWQLLIACLSIISIDMPVHAISHQRPLLIALTYLSSALAPPGSQTSFFGLITFPLQWMPYAMIFMDMITQGPKSAAASIGGAIVGHIWWWGVFGRMGGGRTGLLARYGVAPRWMRKFVSDGEGVRAAGVESTSEEQRRSGGRDASARGETTGHQWGTGNRLGNN